jgi:Protein of unknown function (DUF2851)
MQESFLYHVWKFKLFNALELQTTTGEKIELIKPGTLQPDSGPDFFNAHIKIGETKWAGNIEIDLKTSDWKKHGHDKDPAYSKIILHVVYENDKPTLHSFPILELKNYLHPQVFSNYQNLNTTTDKIPCKNQIATVDTFIIESWFERMLVERLETKTSAIKKQLLLNNNNWEETFYHHLAKNFGFKTNAVPFEMLAKNLPLNVLAKHKNNLLQTEAMLFGVAGFLNDPTGDDYYFQLQKEFHHLKTKFSLVPIEKNLWKFLRLRPVNFPTVRIAQFAALIHNSSHLFSKIIEIKKVKDLYNLFEIEASAYWHNHFLFGKETKQQNKHIGESSVSLILINTVIPFLFLYGKERNEQKFISRSIQFLEQIKFEKNVITNEWLKTEMPLNSAAQSQSLIELYNNYCTHKKCLQCAVGLKILNRKEII